MKLIIDIDDGLYKAICDCESPQILSHFAIKNGTPYEERALGEWIDTTGRGDLICSVCNHKAQIGCIEYCGACGTKMKNGVKQDELSRTSH